MQYRTPFAFKTRVCTFLCLSFLIFANAQKVEWISFEAAIERNKENPKHFLIDIYTDWCGYCKKMDRDTYAIPAIANYINKNFHAVKFNAEQREALHYNDNKYGYVPNGRRGYHEFAAALLEGKLSYPSTVIFDPKEVLLTRIPGYLKPEQMEPILVYFADEKYKTLAWNLFEKSYQSNW